MKSYKERTTDILNKRDDYLAMKRKIRKTVYSVCSVAACVVIGVGILGAFKIIPGLKPTISNVPYIGVVNSASISDVIPNSNSAKDSDIIYYDSNVQANIVSFKESLIENSCAILEGTITNIYNKEYLYETPYNKFGTSGVIHSKLTSIIYEIKVNKVWYGSDDFTEKTYLIEDANQTYSFDETSSLKVGGKYVLPIYIAGVNIYIPTHSASSNMTRDSQYSTNYPYHSQIQVTDDDKYIITTDWPTLLEAGSQEIMFDDKSTDASKDSLNLYSQKMRLVSKASFTTQIGKLIEMYFK